MSNNAKFSIVLPAYNCEKYIAQALDSLVNQDTSDSYEVIITDDGSTDTTGTICDTYAEKYQFIHVNHTDNHGPSHARNVALDQCTGEYILFCDADDVVSPQLVSVVAKAVEVYGRPDIIVYRYFMNTEHEGSRIYPKDGWPMYDVNAMKVSDGVLADGEDLCARILTDPRVQGFSHNKAVRHDVCRDIRYDEELSLCEDEHYFMRIAASRQNMKVCYINYYLYYYINRFNLRLTQDKNNLYDEKGMYAYVSTREKMLTIGNLTAKIISIIKGEIYQASVIALWLMEVNISDEARQTLRRYLREYAYSYYFEFPIPVFKKVKTLIKHLLVLLHIHK